MTSEERKIKALAQLLEIEPEAIELDAGEPDRFIVSPHDVRRGTSPSEARRLIDQLRGVLERVIGPQTKEWTTDTFYKEVHEYKAAKERAEDVERELKSLERDLPTIKSPYNICELCDEIDYRESHLKMNCKKCKNPITPMGQRRKVRMIDLAKMSADFRRKALPALKLVEQERAKLLAARDEYLSRYIYAHIISLIKVKEPDALEIGTHEVANTLHFLFPQTTYNHAKEHRESLGEAFDGVEVKDRTRFEPTDCGQYLVLTDDEADTAWDESMQHYLEELVLPELPEQARRYFDEDAWKEDAKQDGRGHALGQYDGEEREIMIDGEWLYIYRIN